MTGKFYGIGVGPGEQGMISVAAWECLQKCDLIFVPKATTMPFSLARSCLPPADIPDARFREVEFAMDADRDALTLHYDALASSIGDELRAGKDVAYLTLGDAL
ncbi:MAG: precorrin-2 C(20)-methyltransferase, partial [Verrucomicrobia bacterium]|nr:precorrin-2 C(20)-methyltransferase [Verrucomicrobiota bacterium]